MLNNTTFFPFGFGFSCLLNTYEIDNNFGSRWVAENTGGVTFYGSTTISYDVSNRYLGKHIWETFKSLVNWTDNFSIAQWLLIGETKYLCALTNNSRRHQVLRYNLIGDPTLYIWGRNS